MTQLWHKFTSSFGKLRRALALAPLADELHDAWQERDERPLNHHEREMLENALALGEITAEDVCVPRSDISAVPMSADYKQIMRVFTATYHSRLPVFGDDLDDIRGVVTLKDMLAFADAPKKFSIEQVLRPVVFVPETMALPRILQQMKKHKSPMVLVSDEFGGMSGLLVLKDILEELVGEMEDEHEQDEVSDIVETAPGVYRMAAATEIEEAEELLKLPLEDWAGDDVDTLGGWVTQKAQRIPQKGDVVDLGHGLKAVVTSATPRQLQRLELHVSLKK